MVVRDLMSSSLHTVRPDEPVEVVAQIMRSENIGVVPVCDNQRHLLGLITDRDIIMRQGLGCGRQASEIMTVSPVTVQAKDNIHDAALEFSRRGVRRLPVLENGKLIGMLSLRDLARKRVYAAEIGHIIYAISNFEESAQK